MSFLCGSLPYKVVAASVLINLKHILYGSFGAFLLLGTVAIKGVQVTYRSGRMLFCCCLPKEWTCCPGEAGEEGFSVCPSATTHEATHPIMFHWWKLLYEQMERSWVRETSKKVRAMLASGGCCRPSQHEKERSARLERRNERRELRRTAAAAAAAAAGSGTGSAGEQLKNTWMHKLPVRHCQLWASFSLPFASTLFCDVCASGGCCEDSDSAST